MSKDQRSKIAVLILAAGASTRMNQPKQLISVGGSSLLNNAVKAATQSSASKVFVVLGANAADISAQLENSKATLLLNDNWKEGIASSIRTGVHEIQINYPEADATILMVCDQPFINTNILNELINEYKLQNKMIIASKYDNNVIGTPVLFDQSLFNELLLLKGDTGAKKIIVEQKDRVGYILFPKGNIDIDTPEDYNNLENGN